MAHREIILLCDVDEMSYREIAQVLDVPTGTVMSRLARARRNLRAALGSQGGGAMMACSQDRNMLAAYLDGELTADQERSLQEHLRNLP